MMRHRRRHRRRARSENEHDGPNQREPSEPRKNWRRRVHETTVANFVVGESVVRRNVESVKLRVWREELRGAREVCLG